MLKFAARSIAIAIFTFVAQQSSEAQSIDTRNQRIREKGLAVQVRQACEGLLCDLTPQAMTQPLTVSQAMAMQLALLSRTPQRTKRAKIALRALPRLAEEQGQFQRGDVDRTQRVAIFSLFDPVVTPGDYGRWLRRVPRTDASLQAAVPAFPKKQPT